MLFRYSFVFVVVVESHEIQSQHSGQRDAGLDAKLNHLIVGIVPRLHHLHQNLVGAVHCVTRRGAGWRTSAIRWRRWWWKAHHVNFHHGSITFRCFVLSNSFASSTFSRNKSRISISIILFQCMAAKSLVLIGWQVVVLLDHHAGRSRRRRTRA